MQVLLAQQVTAQRQALVEVGVEDKTLAQVALVALVGNLAAEAAEAAEAQLQVVLVAQVAQVAYMSGPGSLTWSLTPWQMSGAGTWKTQPVILVEGRVPFFADHPDDYIDRLQAMHDDPELARGPFWTLIGQLRDAYEQAWQVMPQLEVVP